MKTETLCSHGGGDRDRRSVVVELPLGDAAATFDLEKAVCSHGLFMMAPNQWDPLSKSLQRPLRLHSYSDSHSGPGDDSSVSVRICQHSDTLILRVFDIEILSPQQQQILTDQVRRMLRLAETEEKNVRGFQEVYGLAKERGFGRIFRSPTLFEDMVKCMLLCNCQWSRTLSMARALCELQLELQSPSSSVPVAKCDDFRILTMGTEKFAPKTPAKKESRKKIKVQVDSTNLGKSSADVKEGMEAECLQEKQKLNPCLLLSDKQCDSSDASTNSHEVDSCSFTILQSSEKTDLNCYRSIGNFPSPRELAGIDTNFLAKRCNLGYRARRISSLA